MIVLYAKRGCSFGGRPLSGRQTTEGVFSDLNFPAISDNRYFCFIPVSRPSHLLERTIPKNANDSDDPGVGALSDQI
jgi:hypothetical protein